MKRILGTTAIILAILPAPAAKAVTPMEKLENLASSIANTPTTIVCPPASEWKDNAGGYVMMDEPIVYLSPDACKGARAVASGNKKIPRWQRAHGILTLAHEAWHVRKWKGRYNENEVECRALSTFLWAVERVSSRKQAKLLYPLAVEEHRFIKINTKYQGSC